MAYVYIIYSKKVDKYYTGSCLDLSERLMHHNNHIFDDSYTRISDDWELYFSFSGLAYQQARKIEQHIKRMKSRQYIENLKKYPEIVNKLIAKYK